MRICVTAFTGNIHYQQHLSRVVSKINLRPNSQSPLLTADVTSPPPLHLSKGGLKLVCNVNILDCIQKPQVLRTLKIMPRNLNEIVRSWIWLLQEKKKNLSSNGNKLEKHNLHLYKTYISCNHLFTPNILCDIGVDFWGANNSKNCRHQQSSNQQHCLLQCWNWI